MASLPKNLLVATATSILEDTAMLQSRGGLIDRFDTDIYDTVSRDPNLLLRNVRMRKRACTPNF